MKVYYGFYTKTGRIIWLLYKFGLPWKRKLVLATGREWTKYRIIAYAVFVVFLVAVYFYHDTDFDYSLMIVPVFGTWSLI